jgi:nucleoside-diphosphate-sugar epimerase
VATRVLISGADGFIGGRCVPLLRAAGAEVLPVEDVVPGIDLLGPGATEAVTDACHPDVVLHLAWVASSTVGYRNHPDNPRWRRVTAHWAEACLDRSIWFVGTGTVAEVDSPGDDAYTAAKVGIWSDLRQHINKDRMTWLRPHYVFDPVLGRPEAMAEINSAIAQDRAPELRSPLAAHDFIHVADVAAAIPLVISEGFRGLVPVGSGRLHSVAQLARAAGARGYESAGPPGQADTLHTADITKLAGSGWRPRWTEEYFHE